MGAFLNLSGKFGFKLWQKPTKMPKIWNIEPTYEPR